MKLVYVKGVTTTFEFDADELMVAYRVLSMVRESCGGRTQGDSLRMDAIFDDMTQEVKRKVMNQQVADNFKLCCKCFKEIDLRKDKYHHTGFDSGYEIYAHQECPPVNKGDGYAR
jgi:hypothetical protein